MATGGQAQPVKREPSARVRPEPMVAERARQRADEDREPVALRPVRGGSSRSITRVPNRNGGRAQSDPTTVSAFIHGDGGIHDAARRGLAEYQVGPLTRNDHLPRSSGDPLKPSAAGVHNLLANLEGLRACRDPNLCCASGCTQMPHERVGWPGEHERVAYLTRSEDNASPRQQPTASPRHRQRHAAQPSRGLV